ncbi:acyl-CoA carboxylase subunit epsilon [Wenjunlia tyrosinilytica]|nr:acyl-CoA carboxylase subunit epsilon [Wenjunlia tyrosinilytica]
MADDEREREDGRPLLRVVRGKPDDTEVAAVALVLAIMAGRGGEGSPVGPGARRRVARWKDGESGRTPVSWASGS